MAAAGASAAGFLTITVDGTVVKDGDVIVSNNLKIDGEEYDGEFEMWSWEIAPDFTIGSSEDASYSLTVTNKTESASVVSYCGVTGASTNTMMCQTLQPGDGWNDEGELEAGRSYKVSYDYQHIDLNNLPDKVEIYGQFNVEAEAGAGTESLSFDVNLIWPGEGAVDGIADEEFTLSLPDTSRKAEEPEEVTIAWPFVRKATLVHHFPEPGKKLGGKKDSKDSKGTRGGAA